MSEANVLVAKEKTVLFGKTYLWVNIDGVLHLERCEEEDGE